ncbi:MAG: GDP-mannose 4,6-dehydratase, partial [Elusimicrobia bacterium]|nr:GDP-mannose 4,6-dehydratase [Elusimicrobiota bacterium]
AVAAIKAGRQKILFLGNLQARRDWGYAPEYVEAMWLMVQKSRPGDYVVGTGETHTVGEFCREAFGYAGLDWKKCVKTDARLLRPLEADHLRADASKARRELGWKPRIRFGDLARVMVDADFKAAGLTPPGEGQAALARAFGRRAWFKD